MWGTPRPSWACTRARCSPIMWRVATNKSHTSDELRVKLLPLLLVGGHRDASDLEGVALASVVPQLTQAWCAALQRMLGSDALVCTAELRREGCSAPTYANPAEIGADRVADAVAAQALYGAPVVVVDFGTATNIEVVDRDGGSSAASSRRASRRRPGAVLARHAARRHRAWWIRTPPSAATPRRPSRPASCTARPTAWTASCERIFDQLGYGRRWWPRAAWPPAWRRSRAPSPSRIRS